MIDKIGNRKAITAKPELYCGLHLVLIKEIKWARNSKGEQLHNNDGEPAIEVVFMNHATRTYSAIIWLTAKGIWALDALCKAIGLDNSKGQVDKALAIGRRLFIVIANVYDVYDGIRQEPAKDTELVFKFFPVLNGDVYPVLEGDPVHNKGVPSGIFAIEHEQIKQTGEVININERNFGDD